MKKRLQGKVIKNKMDKTIIVGVETMWKHPRYEKRLRRSKKYFVHDEKNEANVGDQVVIEESHPLSKNKRWAIVEIVKS